MKAQLKGNAAKYAELTEKVKAVKLLLDAKEQEPDAGLATVDERGRRMLTMHKDDVPLAKEDLRNKSKRGMRYDRCINFMRNLIDVLCTTIYVSGFIKILYTVTVGWRRISCLRWKRVSRACKIFYARKKLG